MLHAIALSAVLSIDIQSSSTYRGRIFHPLTVHIARNGNAFLSNGAPVPESAVQALIDALQAPAMNEPTPQALGIGSEALESLEPASMQGCDGVSATQAAQDAYRRRFTDEAAFTGFVRSYYAKPCKSRRGDTNAAHCRHDRKRSNHRIDFVERDRDRRSFRVRCAY